MSTMCHTMMMMDIVIFSILARLLGSKTRKNTDRKCLEALKAIIRQTSDFKLYKRLMVWVYMWPLPHSLISHHESQNSKIQSNTLLALFHDLNTSGSFDIIKGIFHTIAIRKEN